MEIVKLKSLDVVAILGLSSYSIETDEILLILGCQMKNPYIFGYLPFVTIVLFSLTFGVYTVGVSVELFKEIGLYAGMREFLTDIQLRIFLACHLCIAIFYGFFSFEINCGDDS